jgi:hypothetical protein
MGIPPSGDIRQPGVKGDHVYQRHPAMIRGKCVRSIMDTHHYRNARNQMVILRCVGADAFFQEKVIFPFEDWLFSCPPETRIDIWTHGIGGAELLDTMPAEDLPGPAHCDGNAPAEPPSLWHTIGVAPLEADLVEQFG